MARVRVHGISSKEFGRTVKDMKAEVERTFLEREQAYSHDLRDEYVRNFLNQEFVIGKLLIVLSIYNTDTLPVILSHDQICLCCIFPGHDMEARLGKSILALLTREDVETRAMQFHTSRSCVIKASSQSIYQIIELCHYHYFFHITQVVEHKHNCTDTDLEAVVRNVLDREANGLIPPWEVRQM